MQFAVITDIHGNAPALKAVLKRIDKSKSVSHIYCLGDMIGIGPDTNEVLDILFSRSDVSMITGNHDEAILALAKSESYPKSHAHLNEHHKWIADRIYPEFTSKLESLPRTITENVNGFNLRFIHYSIPLNQQDRHISKDPFAAIVEPNLENMENLFKEFSEDLIAFGHHHPIHYFKNEKNTYLNPGSLGCSHSSEASYALVKIKDNDLEITLEKEAYDKSNFIASYQDLQVPDRDVLLRIFHGCEYSN